MSATDEYIDFCREHGLDPDKRDSPRAFRDRHNGKHGSRRPNGHFSGEPKGTRVFNDDDLSSAGFKLAATYDYAAPTGEVIYQAARYEHPLVPGAKEFRLRRRDPTNSRLWLADAGLLKIIYNWPAIAKRPDEPVHFTEGEKDADRLTKLGLLASTVAGGNWSPQAAAALRGRTVYVYEDNDPVGRERAAEAAEWLTGVGASPRVVRLPGLGFKQDVSDWLDAGGQIDELKAIAEAAPIVGFRVDAYVWQEPKSIPPREWIYDQHYIVGFLSATVAPGGVGKSNLVLGEAVAMASGRNLLGPMVKRKYRVLYFNGEEPLVELQRRVAAICLHRRIALEDIAGQLFIVSGREAEARLIIGVENARGNEVELQVPTIEAVKRAIRDQKIEVMIVDPFVRTHAVNENDNQKINTIADQWSAIADETRCAVELVHHTRKGTGGGRNEYTVEDGRGATALHAATRSMRVLNVMSEDEAPKAQVKAKDRRRYFRLDNGKANMAPPPEVSRWFKIESVGLENGTEQLSADTVGVVVPFEWPKVQVVSVEIVMNIQVLIDQGEYRDDPRAANWVGKVIAEELGVDLEADDKEERREARVRVQELVKLWLKYRWLRKVEGKDKKHERRTFIKVGEWAQEKVDPDARL